MLMMPLKEMTNQNATLGYALDVVKASATSPALPTVPKENAIPKSMGQRCIVAAFPATFQA